LKETELAVMTEKFERQRGETEATQQKYEESLKTIEEKNNELNNLKALQKEAANKIELFTYKIKEKEEQLKVKEQRLAALTKEKHSLDAKNEKCNSQLEAVTAKYDGSKRENKNLRARKETLQAEISNMRVIVHTQKTKLAFMKKERDSLIGIVQTIRELVSDVQRTHEKGETETPPIFQQSQQPLATTKKVKNPPMEKTDLNEVKKKFKELKKAFDTGILSKEEYHKKKWELLDQL